MSDLPEPTPDVVRQARDAAGLSQAQAAALVHLADRYRWSEYERCTRRIDMARWELFLIKTGQHPALRLADAPAAAGCTGERRSPSAAPVNDLTGQRYGALLVEGLAEPKRSANGGRLYRAWRCRCDCGRVEDIVAHRLPSTPSNAGRREVMRACSACRRQRSCVVCGAPFESVAPRTTCSAACKRALTNRDLRRYNRRRAERGKAEAAERDA